MAVASDGIREQLAKSLLPLMNDAPQAAFDPPIPDCTAAIHDWAIVHDKTITEQSAWGTMTITYPLAIVCGNCDVTVRMG